MSAERSSKNVVLPPFLLRLAAVLMEIAREEAQASTHTDKEKDSTNGSQDKSD